MKLELIHITPYLPYGLECYFSKNVKEEKRINVLSSILNIKDNPCANLIHPLNQVKPILRPLSDLLNDKIVKSLGLAEVKNDWIEFSSRNTWTNDIPYRVYLGLIKHHFDVFGLIDKNLAIDKNTL